MMDRHFDEAIARLDWGAMAETLEAEGYAMLPGLLDDEQARSLAALRPPAGNARSMRLEDAGLGRGGLLVFGDDLPSPLGTWRSALYRHLTPIGNRWREMLGLDPLRFPARLDDFNLAHLHASPLRLPSHLTRLHEGDFVALHQGADGVQIFSFQLVALLSQPGQDFVGGEFIMTEQRPRMQSRPIVVPLQRGDAAIVCTGQRPVIGRQGPYRVNIKHAIGRVRGGERIGIELSFHPSPGPAQ